MRSITSYLYWFIYCCTSVIPMVLCLHSVANGHVGEWSTIYVDCSKGNDTLNCGVELSPCRTLQFVVSKRVQEITTTGVVINIMPGDCNENNVLRLGNTNVKISHWSFIGSNQTSRPTITHFSVESFNSEVSFSYIEWRQLGGVSISFNVHQSELTFHHCTFKDINLHFIGLNTNLVLQHTSVTNCTSQNPADIPLFFLETLYNYETSMFVQNSTFSYNKGPIIYATKYQEIFMQDTLFYKNGKDIISNSSLVTVSASSVILKNSIFNHTLGTAVAVKSAKNFTATRSMFLSNTGSRGSCFFIKSHSKITLVDTILQQNTNPVVFVNSNDDVNISFKKCQFGCLQHKEETNLPFIKAPDQVNITVTNCNITRPCSVHCKNGELVKSDLYCEKCHAGHFSYNEDNLILSDSCQSCPAGTYSSNTGSTNCSVCAEGTYAQKSGNEECKKCTNDFFTSDAGANGCSKMTLEFILVMVATIPLISIPLLLLLGRFLQKRSLKLKAQLQCGKKYGRFKSGESRTTNADAKDFLSQGVYSNY